MSNIHEDQKKLNNEAVFRTDTQKDISEGRNMDLSAPRILRSKSESNLLAGISKKDIAAATEDMVAEKARIEANEAYFNRILENSRDKNLALKVTNERMLEKDGFVNVAKKGKSYDFRQQYPSAVKDKWFGSSENAKIKSYKRKFRNADLNTVREYPALRKFFNSEKFMSGPVGEGAKDESFNSELTQYVNYLLSQSIDSRSFTDDYLSKHINEVYEFTWKLSKYRELRFRYLKFFEMLPETKKIALERMAASADDLKDLVDSHLYLHGMKISTDKHGETQVFLREESDDKEERHRKRRELKAAYDKKYNRFMKTAFLDKEYALAREFADNTFLNESKDLLETLNAAFNEDKEALELFGPQINTAMEEIRKALDVRDQLVEEQSRNLRDKETKGDRNGDLKRAVRHTNDKLLLCSKHIDNYKQYLYFLNGNIRELPKDTVEFLAHEKHEDLLEPVNFKSKLECVEEALALKKHLAGNDGKSIEGIKKNKKDSKAMAGAKEVKRPAFKAPEKMTREQFYAKRREYNKAVKESEDYTKLIDKWTEERDDTLKRAEQYAKDYNLRKNVTRYALNFVDPGSEFLKEDDYFWITLAANYEPTDKTPKEVVEKIRDRGVKPWVDEVLALKPEEYKDIALSKDDDPLKEGYFKKLALFELGWDAGSFATVMNRYGLDLTDEQFLKIKIFSMRMGDYSAQMDYVKEKMQVPFLKLIGNDERIASDANDLTGEIFDNSNRNKEVVKFLDRYETEATGIELNNEQLIKGSKKNGVSVSYYISNILRPLSNLDLNLRYSIDDYNQQYEEAKKRAEKEHGKTMYHTRAAQEKKKVADAGYPEMSDAQIDIRLWLKDYNKRLNPIPVDDDAQKAAFKKTFGTRTDGAADVKNFRRTQHFVELDPNDTVRSAYRGKDRINKMDFEEYTAGGEKRQRYLKRKLNEILSFQPVLMKEMKEIISIKDEQKRNDYITAHFRELNEKNQIMQGFKNIASENVDFLGSNEFTEKEQNAFRLYTQNPMVDTLNRILESFAESLGMKTTGEELPLPALKNEENKEGAVDSKKARQQAQEARQKNALDKMNKLVDENLTKDIHSYESFESLMKEKPEMVRKVISFEERVRFSYSEYTRKKREYDEKAAPILEEQADLNDRINKEEDSKKRGSLRTKYQQNSDKIMALQKQYEGATGDMGALWQERAAHAAEIKDYLLGYKDIISDEALVFAEQNGFAEYFKKEDMDDAAFRIEKKSVMKAYGYPVPEGTQPVVRQNIEQEIRQLLGLKDGDDIEKALDKVAKIGVDLKRANAPYSKPTTSEENGKFDEQFGGSSVTGDEDRRCFVRLLEPVRRDVFGNPLPGYEENAKKNVKSLEDYLSGDEKKVRAVLRQIADKVLKTDISEEKMTEEYFNEHPGERLQTYVIIFNFMNYYKFKKDFFTGDSFTKEQQDDLRKKGESDIIAKVRDLVKAYSGKIGYESDTLMQGEGRVFRTNLQIYQIGAKEYKDKYKAVIEKEKSKASPERSEQLRKLAHISGKADRLGLSSMLYKKINGLAEGTEKVLSGSEREELKKQLGEIKEVENAYPFHMASQHMDWGDGHPWLDENALNRISIPYGYVKANKERVLASDDLYQTLVRMKENGEKVNEEELRGKIKAYTDRLLWAKLDKTSLNEEYISNNYDRFVEYTRAHALLPHIMKYYPGILDSLSVADRISVMSRNENHKKVGELLSAFNKMNGVKRSLTKEKAGDIDTWKDIRFALRDKEKPSEVKTGSRKYDFEQALKETVEAHEKTGEAGKWILKKQTQGFWDVWNEETGTGIGAGNACTAKLYDYESIEKSLKKNEALYKNCKPYYDKILEKYRKDASDAEGSVYNARIYMDGINEITERLDANREILKQQERLKASKSREYNDKTVEKAKDAIKRDEVNLKAHRKNLEALEKGGSSVLKMYEGLERYHELFRLASGEGGVLSEETEKFLNEKGLTDEYGMILANIVIEKSNVDVYADRILGAALLVNKAKRSVKQHTGKILENEEVYRKCYHGEFAWEDKERDKKIRGYFEGLEPIEFNEDTLSDVYIAEHLGEFIKYIRAYDHEHIESIKERDNKNAFGSLPQEKQDDIMARREYTSKVAKVVWAFTKKYGIEIKKVSDGLTDSDADGSWSKLEFEKGKLDAEPLTREQMAALQKDLDDARKELLEIVRAQKEEALAKAAENAGREEPGESPAEEAAAKEETAGEKTAVKEESRPEATDADLKKTARDLVGEILTDVTSGPEEGETAETVEEQKTEDKKVELKQTEEALKKEEEEKRRQDEIKKAEEEKRRQEEVKKAEEKRLQKEAEEIKLIEEEFRKLEESKKAEDEYPLPQHEAEPKRVKGIRYETQTTNNCWCCSGTFIFNQFNGLNQMKEKKARIYKQGDMRKYVPKIKSLNDLKKEGYDDKNGRERSISELKEYAGKGKTEPGNIYEVADFFLEKRKDIMVHQIVFHTPGTMEGETEEKKSADKDQINKQRESFLNEVKKVLDTQNYVAVNRKYGDKGHYRTIIGIKGKTLKCLNSSMGDEPEYLPVNFFIKKYGEPGFGAVELNWLSKKPARKELLKSYGDKGLVYDEKNKTYSAELSGEGSMNVGQTLGVNLLVSQEKELGMAHSVYIPKKA